MIVIGGPDCSSLMEKIAMPVTYCGKYGRNNLLQFLVVVRILPCVA